MLQLLKGILISKITTRYLSFFFTLGEDGPWILEGKKNL